MSDVKDYSALKDDNSHYAVPSMYGKICKEQYNQQPKYCEPGMPKAGKMMGAKSNPQKGA